MSQCVPSWDLDNISAPPRVNNVHAHPKSANSLALDVPSLDCEQMAELTWENGQLPMHGSAASRVEATKPAAAAAASSLTKYPAWDKTRTGGTLESIVDQATSQHHHDKSTVDGGAGDDNINTKELVPWFDHHCAVVNPAATASVTVTMDALVPCNNNINNNNNNIQYKNIENKLENSAHVLDSDPGTGTFGVGCSTRVGSCSAAATDGGAKGGRFARAGVCRCGASESATCGAGRKSRRVTVESTDCEMEFGGGGSRSTSLLSLENTSSGGEYTRTSAEDHDSVCHSRSQREAGGDRKRKGTGKSSVSKKSRAAASHNQSERKRREKINQKMKTLQKMVPNSSKTDKASMLDEVIEYLKQLQAQAQVMRRMNMPPMMFPLAMQQQLQMSMMAPAMGMGMGVMNMNTMGCSGGMPAADGFMPWDNQGGGRSQSPAVMPDILSALLAYQSQPMTIDAYSRLAALYQQFQQAPSASGSKI